MADLRSPPPIVASRAAARAESKVPSRQSTSPCSGCNASGSVAFRKAEDVSGEFKAPAPREVEVFPSKEIEIYLIPTEAGTYDLVCEIEGHFEAGMFGTITVEPAT